MKNCFAFVLFLFTATTLRPCLAQGPVVYPPETKNMTDAQFYQWATTTNARQKAEWEARKERAKADQPQYLQGALAKTSVGYSYGRNGGLGGRYEDLGDCYGNVTSTERSYPSVYDNPKYVNPGPLTIINPYCSPRPPTAEELAEIKSTYQAAKGRVRTIQSRDGGGVLHIKSDYHIYGFDEEHGVWTTSR